MILDTRDAVCASHVAGFPQGNAQLVYISTEAVEHVGISFPNMGGDSVSGITHRLGSHCRDLRPPRSETVLVRFRKIYLKTLGKVIQKSKHGLSYTVIPIWKRCIGPGEVRGPSSQRVQSC